MMEEYIYTGTSGNRYRMTKDDTLIHWGVPKMKWGVRRYQNEDGSYKSGAEGRYYHPDGNKKKKAVSEDYERSRSKTRKEMSDDELRTAVNRLNNERQYEMYKKELDKSDNDNKPVKEKKKNLDEMNDDELNKAVERLNKEKQYKQLTEDNNSDPKDNKKGKVSKEHKISTKFKSQQLSDEELDNAINRLNKEKQYRQLVEESKNPIAKAASDAAKYFAKTVFDTAVSEFTKSVKESMSSDKKVDNSKKSAERARKLSNIAFEQIKRQRERMKG